MSGFYPALNGVHDKAAHFYLDSVPRGGDEVMCDIIYYEDQTGIEVIASRISCIVDETGGGEETCLCWNSPEQIFSWIASWLVANVGKLERDERLVIEHGMDYMIRKEKIPE